MRDNNALIGDERTTFYQPATFLGFAIIWQRQEIITEAFQKHAVTGFKNEIKPTQNYTIEQKPLDLDSISFGHPLYNTQRQGVCVYRPSCSISWCVWVSNLSDGWSSLLRVLGAKHGWSAIKIRSSQADARDDYIQEMTLFEGSTVARCVRVMRDGKLDFYESGTPMFSEDREKYKERLIAPRLTRQDVARNLVGLGLPVYRPDFWSSPGHATYLWRDVPI